MYDSALKKSEIVSLLSVRIWCLILNVFQLKNTDKSWCFHFLGNSIHLCWSMCMSAHVLTYTFFLLKKKKNSAIIPICFSLLHQSPFLVSQRSKKKKKKDHCHFFFPRKWNLKHELFFFDCRYAIHCEVKTDVVVCCGHAKQPNPTQRVGVTSYTFLGSCTFFWPNADTDTHPQFSSVTVCSLPANTLFHIRNKPNLQKEFLMQRYARWPVRF